MSGWLCTWGGTQGALPPADGKLLMEVGNDDAADAMVHYGTAPVQEKKPDAPAPITAQVERVASFEAAPEIKQRRRNPSRAARAK